MEQKTSYDKLKSGILNKKADVLLRIVPVALAGGGPVTQTIQIDEWLDVISRQLNNIPIRRIGVESGHCSFVDEEITGRVYPIDRLVKPASSVPDIYRNVSDAVIAEMQNLYSLGKRHFAGVCCGYTAYGTFALKTAMKKINKANPDDPITGNIIIQDSSFPDTDKLENEVNLKDYPATRFYEAAYQSTADLKVIFTLNAAMPFDVNLSKRIPVGCLPITSTFPFTDRYIKKWKKAIKTPRNNAIKRLINALPSWSKLEQANNLIIPFLSSDIWDKNSVGKWMTQRQYDTVLQGTIAIINALSYTAKQTSRTVFLPLVKSAVDFILSQNISDIYSVESMTDSAKAPVILLPYDVLSQSLFVDLITVSDLVINRSVQSNSFAETIFAEKPPVVITMPASGYMESELMAQNLKYGLLRYNLQPDKMGEYFYKILTNSEHRNKSRNAIQDTFNAMRSNPETNFGDILACVAGLN